MKNQNTSEFNKIKKMEPRMTLVHKICVIRCLLFVERRQVWLAAPQHMEICCEFLSSKYSRIRIGSGSEKNLPVSPSYSSWPPFYLDHFLATTHIGNPSLKTLLRNPSSIPRKALSDAFFLFYHLGNTTIIALTVL